MKAMLCAFVAILWAGPARALPAETWLVVVGDNHGDPSDESLLYAERDAILFSQTLQQEGSVPARHTAVLLGADATSVREAVETANAAIRAALPAETSLIVFYSGHADADGLHLEGSRLRMDELKTLVAGSPAAIRLLVVDSCRSGGVTRVKGVKPASTFDLQAVDAIATEGLAIITSSAAGEASQESDALRGSFFTHHLVNALRGAADQDGDGQVSLAEAYAYAYAQTLRSSGRTLTLQHPTYSFDVKGKGEVILTRPAESRGRIGRLRLAETAMYLISERQESGPIVAEVAPGRASAVLALPEGDYFVQQRLPWEYREYTLALKAGNEVSLGSLPYREVRYDRLVRSRGSERASVQGLALLAGARGQILDGEGATSQLTVAYTVDLPILTLGARLRGATVSSAGPQGVLDRRRNEGGLGMSAQHIVDFPWASVGFGIVAEAVWSRQSFAKGPRIAPDRTSYGATFSGLLTLERQVAGGLALHLEGGPVTTLFERASLSAGAPQQGLAASFTWQFAAGLIWRV
jgi:hypothetical protein